MSRSDDLELAHHLADIAAELALGYFRGHVRHQWKRDGSPVTEADLAVEHALIGVIAGERPGDAVLSEERGASGSAARRWILDPIDGTYAFLEGMRSWGTHVALEVDGEIEVAVITRPTEGIRWYASKGGGTHRSDLDVPLRVSRTPTLTGARIAGFVPWYSPAVDAIEERATWVHVDLSPIGALIEGRIDGVFGPGGYTWDHAPEVLLVEEAGGRFQDRDGGRRIDQRCGLSTNGLIHDELVAVVAPYW